jgi:hypothetical protein
VQHGIHVRLTRFGQEDLPKDRRVAPAFLLPQSGPKRLPDNVESTAFVPEDIAPAASARGPFVGIAAKGDRSGAGDYNYTRFSPHRARECNEGVIGHQQILGGKHFRQDRLLIGRPAANANTGGTESNIGREPRLLPGGVNTFRDYPYQLLASFRFGDMVARPGYTASKYSPGFIAD